MHDSICNIIGVLLILGISLCVLFLFIFVLALADVAFGIPFIYGETVLILLQDNSSSITV